MSSILEKLLLIFTIVFGLLFYSWTENILALLIALDRIIFSFACLAIAKSKGIEGGYFWGWFLGILGLIVVCVMPSKKTKRVIVENSTKSDKYDELEKLNNLKTKGIITEEEFEEEKKKILQK
ncbi:MAG: SHOCT domain-containing protein [Clostridia bacterium]|nr:SHOCT domain-containing protein [Clostridia bacterium]